MSGSVSFEPPRGMRDFYPSDMAWRNRVFDAFRASADAFGFEQYDACVVENYDLLAATDSLCATGYPVLVGVSSKSLFGKTPGLENSDRLVPSVVVHLLSACAGACVVRAHDVAATREALDVLAMFGRRTSVRSPFFRER